MADEPRVRYSAQNRRPVGQIVVQFRRLRLNGNMGQLETRYIASTLVPTREGNMKFGVESKMHPNVASAFADLKDQLVNRYFVTGAIRIERSASDNVVNAQIDALKRSRNVNEGFAQDVWDRIKPMVTGDWGSHAFSDTQLKAARRYIKRKPKPSNLWDIYQVADALGLDRYNDNDLAVAKKFYKSGGITESFDNDYPNRKDHREPYRKASLRVSRTNRPGGDPDSWDAQNRTFSTRKRELAAQDALKNESLAHRVLRVINKR